MLDFMETILSSFRSCFRRGSTFHWFVIVVIGLMVRSEHLGVTSIIRDLALLPSCYESLIHFFRSSAWNLSDIRSCWYQIILKQDILFKVNDRVLLVGDGVKQAKEGKHMPAVKKLYQQSENSSKPQFIFGHLFGGIGVLIGSASSCFCLPLKMNLQDGLKTAADWDSHISSSSHVIQMIESGFEVASTLGKSLLLLDRYFLSVPALECLSKWNETSSKGNQMELLTKAKLSCVAYHKPVRKSGRGRPPKKGEVVKLRELFSSMADAFQEASVLMYGKEENIRYYAIDLLWGQKLYQELRFVLVEWNGTNSILVSTDLTLEPTTIIALYSRRVQIECTFREFKQQIGGFGYHFWSKKMPKLDRYARKENRDIMTQVKDQHEQELILKTIKAMEGFVLFSSIAMGILQMLALNPILKKEVMVHRYLRTYSSKCVSEATIRYYLQKHIFRMLTEKPDFAITRIIRKQQEKSAQIQDSMVS